MKADLSFADLAPIREAMLSYQQWLKVNGKEPDAFWAPKIRAALEAEGLIKPRSEPLEIPARPVKTPVEQSRFHSGDPR